LKQLVLLYLHLKGRAIKHNIRSIQCKIVDAMPLIF
jgi:hypothetical protein